MASFEAAMGHQEKTDRNAEILALRNQNVPCAEISRRFGISIATVSFIARRMRGEGRWRREGWSKDLHPRLAAGVTRILHLVGTPTAAEVARRCAEHDEEWWARHMKAEKDWLGPRRLKELREWAAGQGHPISSTPLTSRQIWGYPVRSRQS